MYSTLSSQETNSIKSGGYSLIEIMVGILITSIIMMAGFYALSASTIAKVRMVSQVDIDKEVFYFQEKVIDTIKKGGVIDYEEYFNRNVYNTGSYLSGHYQLPTYFGNTPNSFYYCRSKNGTHMGTNGCVSDFNSNANGVGSTNYAGTRQIYGQYALMGIDYNADASADLGNQDGVGDITRDADDEFIGDVPTVLSPTGKTYELYLISGDKKQRTYLRLFVKRDPDAPVSYSCTGLNGNPDVITGSGCLGTIQVLRLRGVDWGIDHNASTVDVTQFDGIVDTWIYDKEFYGLTTDIIANVTNPSEPYWVNLFSESINVKKLNFFLLPTKDPKYAWTDISLEVNRAPIVKIQMTVSPSIRTSRGVKGKVPEFTINTTLNLSSVLNN